MMQNRVKSINLEHKPYFYKYRKDISYSPNIKKKKSVVFLNYFFKIGHFSQFS